MSKILLIEDEDVFVDMFGDSLRKAGFEVSVAKNGAWGVAEALNNNFDLVIVDMVMPAMSGEEVIKKLKTNDKTKNVPIVVISASVSVEMQRRVEKAGIAAFFVKTQIIPSDLTKKVKELLGIN
jgi:CheY-like chemotaxis protein